MAETADWLFWFTEGPGDQYIVPAASIEEAKQKMAAHNLSYDRCGPVQGPGDDMPPGVWKRIGNAT